MGLVALQELPCSLLLFEERTRLSNTLRTLKKAQGAEIPDAPGFALGVVKEKINTNMASTLETISLDQLFREFVEQQEAALGYLMLLPSCHHLASLHRCAQPETLNL